MKPAALAVLVVFLIPSCTSTYPYLIATDECNCERFIYKDERGRFEIEASARYNITDRIHSTLEFVFRNNSREPLSLKQAYLKGSSQNVRYEFNDRFQPMPFAVVPPAGSYMLKLEGSDPEMSDDPWLKIAGEKIVVEMKGMLLGLKPLAPIVITFRPFNPKLAR